MSKVKDHSCVVYDRLKEVVPVEKLSDLSRDEVRMGTRIAFRIIGYIPKNLEKSFEKSWENFTENPQNSQRKIPENSKSSLFEFVYSVWRVDNDILQ